MSITKMSRVIATVVVIGGTLFTGSCGEVARTGRAPVILVIERIEARAGGETEFAGFLQSDVSTVEGAVINDSGRASFRLVLKNPGVPTAPLGPSELNSVTLSHYRVRFTRTDGLNTPGVDVPHGFDGGVTVTIPATGSAEAVFDLVRHANKREPPLSNMRGGGGLRFINTIAEVSFFGRDLAGNEIQAVGTITVNFADFADPE